MELLTGEFHNTLDEKGRISLPAKLRSGLTGNILILTQSVDNCLWLFSPEQWKTLSQNLMDSTSLFQAKVRLVQRRIIAPAQEVELDSVGRLPIAQTLREYASLSKECVILGINKYIEIWDSEEYKKYLDATDADFKQAAEEMGSICL